MDRGAARERKRARWTEGPPERERGLDGQKGSQGRARWTEGQPERERGLDGQRGS